MNKVNNVSFKGVKLYHISPDSLQGKLILEAANKPAIAAGLRRLENYRLSLDAVRNYAITNAPTNFVDIFLCYPQNIYTPKGSMNPLQSVSAEIKTPKDAEKLLKRGLKQAKKHLPEYLKTLKEKGISFEGPEKIAVRIIKIAKKIYRLVKE